MRSSLKPLYLVLGLAGACSLVNKFDPVNDVPAAAGSSGKGGSGGKGGAGGEAGISGSSVTGGTSSGGTGDTGGTGVIGAAGEGGAAGETGNGGSPITGGLVVVATDVGTGVTAKHYVVLLDPADGHELARTQTTLKVLAMAYEAAHDTWFVFTGTPGLSGDATGPLLVGSMNTAGFEVRQTVTVPKPTNQSTVAILNQRILYRSSSHSGANTNDDVLTLLSTVPGMTVKPIGKLTIPYRYSIVSSVGRPNSGGTAGGRVFFLHENIDDATDNCVTADAGTEQACSVYYSSLNVLATDLSLTLPPANISTVAQLDHDGSYAAMAIQPGAASNTVAVVVPPRRALGADASVFRYNAGTGAPVSGGPVAFSLSTPTKPVQPTSSISIATVSLDPCTDLMFTGELANTALLYAVDIGTPPGMPLAFDPLSKNGTVGSTTYEPYSKTLIHYNIDNVNPSFSGFQIGGTPAAPSITVRGKTGAAPWKVPVGIIPLVVVAKVPEAPPCN